jgi:hypothetical protein
VFGKDGDALYVVNGQINWRTCQTEIRSYRIDMTQSLSERAILVTLSMLNEPERE